MTNMLLIFVCVWMYVSKKWLIEDKKPLKADSKASCSCELTLTGVCSVSGGGPLTCVSPLL